MRYIGAVLLASLLVAGCGSTKQLPTPQPVVQYRDSVVVRDSVVTTYLQKEVIKDVVASYDTLKLATTYAEAMAYVDTTMHTLCGSIEQKDDIPVKFQTMYIDRFIIKDSLIPVPFKVEVEKQVVVSKYNTFFWLMLIGYIVALVWVGIKLYLNK